MQNKLNIFLAFGLLTGLWACVAEPKYPNEPHIEYVSVSTTEEYVQTSVFASLTISFTDGNGDLGGSEAENPSCNSNCEYLSDSSCYNDKYYSAFIIDSRDSCFQSFQLPDLTPTGNVKAISGEVDLSFFLNKKTSPNPADTVFYYVIIRDRSGNYSNIVRTDDIVLLY
ncbi:MAG: hypothetical protein R2836_10075 [Chitinophagales bacterium]|nr:hypothetical protein [Chitinophagales bacterium]